MPRRASSPRSAATQGQPVGIDQHRQVGVEHGGQRSGPPRRCPCRARPPRPAPGPPSRSPGQPGPTPWSGSAPPASAGRTTATAWPGRTSRTSPAPPRSGAAHGQHGGTGEAVAARDDAEHTPAVLVGLRRAAAGSRPPRPPPGSAATAGAGRCGPSPMSTSSTTPGVARARIDQQAGLAGAEGHRDIGPHRGAVHHAGVGVHAARQIDRDHQRARAGPAPAAASVASVAYGSRSPPRPPMPSMPSMIRSAGGPADRPGGRALGPGDASCRPRAEPPCPPSWTRPPAADRGHPRAAPGQPGARVKRVAAVVAAAGQHDDARAVDPPEQAGADRRQPGRGPLHQRPGGTVAIRACSAARTVATSCAFLIPLPPPSPRSGLRRG